MKQIAISILIVLGTVGCKSQVEKECEKKIEGLASVFGKADMEKPDWPEKKAAAIKKCVDNGGELRPGR